MSLRLHAGAIRTSNDETYAIALILAVTSATLSGGATLLAATLSGLGDDRARGLCRGVVKKLQKPSRTTTTMIILVAFAVLNKLLEPMGCKAEG